MTQNHFIIGLGGVGGQCIAAFRRSRVILHDDYDFLTKPTSEGGKDFRFEYLYIDSNDDVWANNEIWTQYGEDQKLDESDFLNLRRGLSANLSFRNIIEASNIKPWVGSITENSAKYGRHSDAQGKELIGMKGASQLRRLGRVLFAMNAPLVERQLIRHIEALHPGEIDFHIFCTLGGGTGSGGIMDMVMLIQYLAKQKGATFNVYLYPFVASEFNNKGDVGSFFENEYAALRDLNALMVHTYEPHMAGVIGKSERFKAERGVDPIRAIYISSNMSKRELIEDQIEFIARGCFDCIVLRATHTRPEALKPFTFEDIASLPGEPDPDNPNSIKRSYNFASIGEKRWCVPTEQIKKLIKEEYTIKMLELLRGGSLARRDMDGARVGFSPTSDKQCRTWSVLVKEREREIALLGDVKDLIENKGKDSLKKLRDRSRNAASDAAGLLADPQFVNSIDAAVNRDVEEFEELLKQKVDSVMSWEALSSNPWGIDDVSKFLDKCIEQIDAWSGNFTEGQSSDKSEAMAQALINNMVRREGEWRKIGPLTSILTSKATDMLEHQWADCEALIKCSLLPVYVDTFEKLHKAFCTSVGSLKSKVEQARRKIDDCIDACGKRVEGIDAELRGNAVKDRRANNEQFELDMENLKAVRDAISKDREEHQKRMPHYWDDWKSRVESMSSYTDDKFDLFLDSLDSKLYDDSKDVHDTIVKKDSGRLRNVLVTSIIDRLKQIAGPDDTKWVERLCPKIKQFYEKFSLCSSMSLEYPDAAGGRKTAPFRAMAFGFPKDEHSKLVDFLKEKLRTQLPSSDFGTTLQSETSYFEHHVPGEIRVLYLPYWFPARFVTVVKRVQKIYETTAKDAKKDAIIYFANIDDEDIGLQSTSRPPLYIEPSKDKDVSIRAELTEKLYVKFGDEKINVLQKSDDSITMVLGMSKEGILSLSNRYSIMETRYPGDEFQRDLAKAFELAVQAMSESEKRDVLDAYVKESQDLRRKTGNLDDPAVRAAQEKNEMVRRMLGLR